MSAGGPDLPSMRLEEFLRALGSRTPSPGGGAVAALSGAMGASLLLMVAEYSEQAPAGDDSKSRLQGISERFLELAREDAVAYAAYSAARARRKEEPAAYAASQEAIALVPLEAMERAIEALELLPGILSRAPKWFAGDAAIAAGGLEACAEGMRMLGGVNISGIKGPAGEKHAGRLAKAEERLTKVLRRIEPLILRKLPGKAGQ